MISQGPGGVGWNVAKAARTTHVHVRLCAVQGYDMVTGFRNLCQKSGLQEDVCVVSHRESPKYIAVNDAHKELVVGMADMSIMEASSYEDMKLPFKFEDRWLPVIEAQKRPSSQVSWLVVDANWDTDFLHKWLYHARDCKLSTAFEPTSAAKARRIFTDIPSEALLPSPNPNSLSPNANSSPPQLVDLATPDAAELMSMYDAAHEAGLFSRQDWRDTMDAMGLAKDPAEANRTMEWATSHQLMESGIATRAIQLLPFIPNLAIKLGAEGVFLIRLLKPNDPALWEPDEGRFIIGRSSNERMGVSGVYARLFIPERVLGKDEIVSVRGAGDTFLGALLGDYALRKQELNGEQPRLEHGIPFAMRASVLTLQSEESVSVEIRKLERDAASEPSWASDVVKKATTQGRRGS